MLFDTKGIVIHHVNYGESSIIVNIYTELFGLKSYIVKGVKSKKSKIKISLFEPLTLLELVVYNKASATIQNIKEVKCSHNFNSIPYDISKSTISLFLSEVLFKSIREFEKNEMLFEFLYNSIKLLDKTKEKVTNFHLIFLIELSKYLGFHPNNNYSKLYKYFDLKEGEFFEKEITSSNIVSPPYSEVFSKILDSSLENISELTLANSDKKELLKYIIKLYELHLDSFKNIKSIGVLEEVFQ